MKSFIISFSLLCGLSSFADNEGAFLDAPYDNLTPPIDDTLFDKGLKSFTTKSHTLKLVNSISPVKAQASRGTCSIFSAIALVEAQLALKDLAPKEIDLSEEWLEYLVIARNNKTSDGSNSWLNFGALRDYGFVTERDLPYVGDNWTTKTSYPLQEKRCSHLNGQVQESCFVSHFDSGFLNKPIKELLEIDYGDANLLAQVKAKSLEYKNKVAFDWRSTLNSVSKIKSTLLSGTPITMGIEFFYGAWNHSKAEQYGIGRNMHYWYAGIVGMPEVGSMDYVASKKHRAGHSVLIVGYDDNRIVERTEIMTDGTYKKFTYKGVYYFKNSWGTGGFGSDFRIDGVNLPGYGMITYDYANRYGSFYSMPIK